MRSKIAGLVLGLGLVAATAAPSLANCPFHDQSASAQQQQTAQTQQQTETTTQ